MAYQPTIPYWEDMKKDETSSYLSRTYSPLDMVYLKAFTEIYVVNETTSQDEFEPTEEEIRVFENIKKGKEKMTRQSAEDLIKELNDMSDEQS